MTRRLLAATASIAILLSAFGSAGAGGLDRTRTGSIKPAETPAAPIIPFAALINKYAAMNGVDRELAHAIVRIESNYNPRTRGSAGEVGLMQIKPATARMMGYQGSVKGLYDPETNIRYGMKYLAMAQTLGGGTTCSTVLKYNAGHAATRMNPVSKRYCGKVTTLLAAAG